MDLKDKKQLQNCWKNHNFKESLRHALAGLACVWHEERNFRFDVFVATAVIILGVLLHLQLLEWLWLGWAIMSVLVSELWNTVLENVVDLVTQFHRHPLAKKAKDMASAAVLLNAVFAAIIGLSVLGFRLWQLLAK
ncbi:MAG: diacylglycerol kinase family protein [Liquorilactobacillus nagelii]|jgi:undecaprenol kinase|uniref:UDP kinase n=1 Tax=Liquorilactobacillus nagelii TaxID=82688 RepID=A0A3S6QW50_9LACO|nr:diacylglycerol kinase family protein [Liquorilactobacillus nagelii]AUJ32218.1 UDP kinase [Liquorilactobacillus nagelii]MCC7615391.1 UDP kinase [Liquorilactobacillus nagelii]